MTEDELRAGLVTHYCWLRGIVNQLDEDDELTRVLAQQLRQFAKVLEWVERHRCTYAGCVEAVAADA